MRVTLFDIAIIIIYFVLCFAIGLHKFYKIDTPKKFALGYSTFSSGMLMCIILSTTIGAGTIFGYTNKLYILGLGFLIAQLVKPIYWYIMSRIFGGNIDKFLGCTSLSEVMYKLYGTSGRWISAAVSIVYGLGFIAVQALAIGHVFNYFLAVPLEHGIILSYTILTIYSMLGGIRAVALTEVFQFFIFLFVIPLSLICTLYYGNESLVDMVNTFPPNKWGLQLNTDNILLIASFVFYALIPDTSAPIIQRCLMASNSKQLTTSLQNAGWVAIPITAFMCLIGYIISATHQGPASNELFLSYINNLPIGIKGLMITGIIGAIMGLAESWLNSGSVILTNDVLKVAFPRMSEKFQLLAMRLCILVLSIASIQVALSTHGIIEVIWLIDNFSAPLILVPLITGFIGFKVSHRGFIASSVFAMIAVGVGRYVSEEFGTISLMFGIFGSCIGLFGTHYLENLNGFKKVLENLFTVKKPEHLKFCVFTFAYYFLYLFHVEKTHHITLIWFISIGYALCFIMLLKDIVWSEEFKKKFFRKYWYICVTFCIPSTSAYILLTSNNDTFWTVNAILSCVSLLFFVNAIEFIIVLTIGLIIGVFVFAFTGEISEVAPTNIGYWWYIYIAFLIIAYSLLRSKEKAQQELIDKTIMFGGAIAHEVRSPIAAMMMSLEAVNGILYESTGAITKDKDGKYKFEMDENDYDYLKFHIKSLSNTGARAIGTVNHILTSMKTEIPVEDSEECSVAELVEESKKLYIECEGGKSHLSDKQIVVEVSKDFKINCIPAYIHQVILNLLKNAHHHGGHYVTVKIWNEGRALYIEDDGKGVPRSKLETIFDSFTTTSSSGTGIGLSFCKKVIEAFGGVIECKSEVGQYTRFVMMFTEA